MQQTVAALCREWIVPEANGSAWRPAADDDADAVDVPGLAEILQTRALLAEGEVVEFAPLPRDTVVDTERGRFRQREVNSMHRFCMRALPVALLRRVVDSGSAR